MAQVIVYLKFENNCREAMNFYKECFGGELIFQTVKGSVIEAHMKPEEGEKILHSSLLNDQLLIFASEMTTPKSVGDTIFLWLNCNSDSETKTIFSNLSKGGKVTAEIQPAYWGSAFGAITDRFGINWYISTLHNYKVQTP